MDLSAMIVPILQAITSSLPTRPKTGSTIVSSRTSSSHSNTSVVLVDRALGTVASIGLTLAVYRLLTGLAYRLKRTDTVNEYDDGRRKKNEEELEGYSLSSVSVQVVLRGLYEGLTGGWIEHPKRGIVVNEEKWYSGSCHCGSIRFQLQASTHLHATYTPGKIRYPHIKTTASSFRLVDGAPFLSVYYVRLPPPPTKSLSSDEEGTLAAHTFCQRCGTHLLRASDPQSDELEVNTNCLDELYHGTKGGVTLQVAVENDEGGRGLGGGTPIQDQLRPSLHTDEDENDTGEGVRFTPVPLPPSSSKRLLRPQSSFWSTYATTANSSMEGSATPGEESTSVSPPSTASSEMSSFEERRRKDDVAGRDEWNERVETTRRIRKGREDRKGVVGGFSLGSGVLPTMGGEDGSDSAEGQGKQNIALTQLKYYMRKHTSPPVSDVEGEIHGLTRR